jgi:hypothetical protein
MKKRLQIYGNGFILAQELHLIAGLGNQTANPEVMLGN